MRTGALVQLSNLPWYPRREYPVTHSTGGTGGKSQRLHVRYALWDATGGYHDYSPATWRDRAMEEQLSLPGCRLYYLGYGFAR